MVGKRTSSQIYFLFLNACIFYECKSKEYETKSRYLLELALRKTILDEYVLDELLVMAIYELDGLHQPPTASAQPANTVWLTVTFKRR